MKRSFPEVGPVVATAPESTRQKLLDTALAMFAERGYEAASVREICDAAGANIAAVNYHFGGKERLYIEAVKAAHCCINSEIPMPDWPAGTPARTRLREFIGVFVRRMLREDNPHAAQLMMRELAHPTAACAEVVEQFIRPMAHVLQGILGELVPDVPFERRFLHGFSVVGQCLLYKQNRPVIRQLMGDEVFAKLTADELADHITRFTLGGLGVGP